MWEFSTPGHHVAPPGYEIVTREAPFTPEPIPDQFAYWDPNRRCWSDLTADGKAPLWCFYWARAVCAPVELLTPFDYLTSDLTLDAGFALAPEDCQLGVVMRFASFFSGIGAIDLGLERAGWQCVSQAENSDRCLPVLRKHWPEVPKYGDITTLDAFSSRTPTVMSEGFLARTTPKPTHREIVDSSTVIGLDSGGDSPISRVSVDPDGSSPRTSPTYGIIGCPTCGPVSPETGMPPCRWSCTPVASALPTDAHGSSWWPTPTETANHCAPSMRKWPAYARFQSVVGTGGHPHPEVFEWMMGLPEGWTDAE